VKNVVLVALLGACLSAQAQPSSEAVQVLVSSCRAYSAGLKGGDYCAGALAAATEGILEASLSQGKGMGLCPPGDVMRMKHAAEAVVEHMRRSPGDSLHGTYVFIESALRRAYPCRPKGTPG
jgi:hypothetical protein